MKSLSQPATKPYTPSRDFIRVAAATPTVAIGNIATNLSRITALFREAVLADVSLVVFPELSITGYSIQDLVNHSGLLSAARLGLGAFARETEGTHTVAVVGLPLVVGNGIYNTAAVVSDGEVRGIVPKQNLPTYNEFYEKRWYQAWDGSRENIIIDVEGHPVTFGTHQLFQIGTELLGIEICEDLWVPRQPSIELAANGATIIANPSASPETVTKSAYRRALVSQTAARMITGYVYVSADQTESTAEIVMSGHAMINEAGTMLAERAPFTKPQPLLIADIDTLRLKHDRCQTTNFPNDMTITPTPTGVTPQQTDLRRFIDADPFLPKGNETLLKERCDEILNIQAAGLARRMEHAKSEKLVLGLSGGLDSTLAFLVGMRASVLLERDPRNTLYTLTMPGKASSQRTQSNAAKLAAALGISNEEIPIGALSADQLVALGHGGDEDVTYENTQARLRQAFVFNKANQIGGLALGTGDMSEIALGWCTYNGDHMSSYNVNASIPKTLVRTLVRHAAEGLPAKAKTIIEDILDTPVSPELTGNGTTISQATEDIIGPYELHDFFLYHLVRLMEPKDHIRYLAVHAFEGRRTAEEIDAWLDVFLKRFYQNQWKRQAMPDGAKVGISLSPKGDWRMAPDMSPGGVY